MYIYFFVKASFMHHDQKYMASVTLKFFFLHQFVFNRHVTVEKKCFGFCCVPKVLCYPNIKDLAHEREAFLIHHKAPVYCF